MNRVFRFQCRQHLSGSYFQHGYLRVFGRGRFSVQFRLGFQFAVLLRSMPFILVLDYQNAAVRGDFRLQYRSGYINVRV